MMKEEVVTEKVTKKTYFCDICTKQMDKYRKCAICKKDLCREHAVYDYGEGDSYEVYCIDCWNIGKDFRQKMKEEDERSYKIQEDLDKKWRKLALLKAGE